MRILTKEMKRVVAQQHVWYAALVGIVRRALRHPTIGKLAAPFHAGLPAVS